jgi:hypothetical protein
MKTKDEKGRKLSIQGDLSINQEHLTDEQLKALVREFDYYVQKDSYQGHKINGGYLIAFSTEYARNLSFPSKGRPRWQSLKKENAHIGIAVHDEKDLHFIVGLTVTVSVMDSNGNDIGTKIHPLLLRPGLYHYGVNWVLPGDGEYTIHVKIETPETMLYNEENNTRYLTSNEVNFFHVNIKTGQKIS